MNKQRLISTKWQAVTDALFAIVISAPRWLRIVTAAVLMLLLSCATPVPHANAQGYGVQVRFLTRNGADPKNLCTGVKYYFIVTQSTSVLIADVLMNQPPIGTVAPSQAKTDKGGLTYMYGAVFSFESSQAGSGTISFTVVASEGKKMYVLPGGLDFTVKDCNLKVILVNQWNVPGDAHVQIRAIMDNAEMKADDQGHYTGSGTVNWVASAGSVGTCGGAIDIGSSGVSLTGDMNDSGDIAMQMNFDPAAVEFNVDCGEGAGGSRQETATPDALAFTMPSTGGSTTQPQGLSGPGASGTSTIIVVPDNDEASAYRPGSGLSLTESFIPWDVPLRNYLAWFAGF